MYNEHIIDKVSSGWPVVLDHHLVLITMSPRRKGKKIYYISFVKKYSFTEHFL